MALTKRQTLKAARLYGLAMAAYTDSIGAETDDESRVLEVSRELAEAALARLGYDKSQLVTIQQCISAVSSDFQSEL
ncbi:hypothetical protein SAMN03159335_06211 [Burkholderia cepacia]|uniref:hypothetical protein n=1 Tax=Burkholderia cepacia TaxID=292 RepID=UPI0008D10847|nr:hypothetical protein [Burkholderia cepacia]SEU40153.1 hypothetical protein SAMN03159335_06211 [Burkholderia cepacia]